jgi:hypothetical protein
MPNDVKLFLMKSLNTENKRNETNEPFITDDAIKNILLRRHEYFFCFVLCRLKYFLDGRPHINRNNALPSITQK